MTSFYRQQQLDTIAAAKLRAASMTREEIFFARMDAKLKSLAGPRDVTWQRSHITLLDEDYLMEGN